MANVATAASQVLTEPMDQPSSERLVSDFCKGFARGLNRGIDHFVGMHDRYETSFENGRCEVHATIQHAMEETIEAFGVRLHHVSKAVRDRREEVKTEHATHAIGAEFNASILGSSRSPSRGVPLGRTDDHGSQALECP